MLESPTLSVELLPLTELDESEYSSADEYTNLHSCSIAFKLAVLGVRVGASDIAPVEHLFRRPSMLGKARRGDYCWIVAVC